MDRAGTNVIVLEFKSANKPSAKQCSSVYLQYRGAQQSEFVVDRDFLDRWSFEPVNQIVLGGQIHMRTNEPGVLRIRLQCPGMGLSFSKIEVIRPTVGKTYQQRFFQEKNISSWEEWADKQKGTK